MPKRRKDKKKNERDPRKSYHKYASYNGCLEGWGLLFLIFSDAEADETDMARREEELQQPSITHSLKSENIYEPQIVAGGGGPRSLTGGTRV